MKHKVIVQDTASSAIGKIITKLCVKNGIKIINIARKQEHIEAMQKLGSSYSLNSASDNFFTDLQSAIDSLNPSLYVTFQGGNFPSRVFERMPNETVMCSCGNINNEKLWGYSTTDFIFKSKTIIGFQIFNYFPEMTKQEKEKTFEEILESAETYSVNIVKEYDLNEFQQAKEDYEKKYVCWKNNS